MIKHSKPFVDEKDVKSVSEIIKSGVHADGSKVKEFEEAICKYVDAKYGKAVNSGTSALHLALLALDVKKDDEVIIPSYVCQSVMSAVNYCLARPILVDVADDGYNLSIGEIKRKINNKTKAIIAPHMFGFISEVDSIMELGVPVIEDCAQSFGSEYNGKKVGGIGTVGVFSFYATKIISTGHGGMIVTSSKKIKKRLDELSKYDKKKSYSIGYNYSMTDIQAVLGLSQLLKVDGFLERRKEIKKKYDEAFGENRNAEIPYRYVLEVDDVERVIAELKLKGIVAERPVFWPLHRYLRLDGFENSERAYESLVSIPIYPALTDEEVGKIIREVSNCLSRS